jgi:hypothetical protein
MRDRILQIISIPTEVVLEDDIVQAWALVERSVNEYRSIRYERRVIPLVFSMDKSELIPLEEKKERK